ncbi:uncharacterized protein FIBRA_00856 [Fibroporia radiculosa]|uniref:Cytochrome c oxidase assembly protein COX20, mitochondrial n=1 Tax=Fibroporia radiculosa TaxID=599839 RepID=J4GIS1_9APHY|nr:uncharacterized protein FIBRA_00856 [Fibroporia radiculosa]CCL98850.1 predicted protein [Fibroporia radiculosa]
MTDSPSESPSSSPKKVVFQTNSTGDYWTDVKEAVKRISFWDDLQKIGEIPCARSSLLSGIASGAGVGVIRGLSAGPFVASNWAVGTFMLISLGTWVNCRRSRDEERRRIQQVVEQIPKRFAKKQDDPTSQSDTNTSAS